MIERAFVIDVEAFDWNCPQHITPRYSELEIESVISPLTDEIERLKKHQRCILAVQIALERAVGQGDLRTVCQTLLDAGALPVSGNDNADPATGGDGSAAGTGEGE